MKMGACPVCPAAGARAVRKEKIFIMEKNDNAPVKYDKSDLEAIRNSVAKGVDDANFKMFISLATHYDLDPFAHEIWCICMDNGKSPVITTSRDGYLKIANRNPHFRGMESDVVYSGDKFYKDNDGVHHAYNAANRGQIIGAYAVVYRDDSCLRLRSNEGLQQRARHLDAIPSRHYTQSR